MYLGQVRRIERKKPAECNLCKKEIHVGESCFAVVRRATSKKDKKYLWTVYVHMHCFIGWTESVKEKRAKYTAERKGGRPPGSLVQALTIQDPEQAIERHKLVREQARLLRYLLVAEDDDRICYLVERIVGVRLRLEKILGFQVKTFNRRSEESQRIIKEKVTRAEKTLRKRGARRKASGD